MVFYATPAVCGPAISPYKAPAREFGRNQPRHLPRSISSDPAYIRVIFTDIEMPGTMDGVGLPVSRNAFSQAAFDVPKNLMAGDRPLAAAVDGPQLNGRK